MVMAIRHVVLIRPAAGVSEAEMETVLERAAKMAGIGGVISVGFARTIGERETTHAKGISHVLTIMLQDLAALEAYRPHPLHREFGGLLLSLAEDLIVIDIAE